MQFDIDQSLVEECEMYIVGHKIFVRMKDIPMYLSRKTKDSIRNRYSHSVEVGLSTEYLLASVSRKLDREIDLNFFGIAKIVGMVHDLGHTAFSHDGEVILDKMLTKASKKLPQTIRFNANLNNFRRIEKYRLFDLLPDDVKKYAMASLVKSKGELREYPEYLFLRSYLEHGVSFEEQYLLSKGLIVDNESGKTILCQAMDIADENRYRVTDIIDILNIYTKQKLADMLTRSITSTINVKQMRKLVSFSLPNRLLDSSRHIDKMSVKELLIMLLDQESSAKTEFQNTMNRISMAFNRNFLLSDKGVLLPEHQELERLRNNFKNIDAKYIWGSKKIKNIKKPFNHYFNTVADYFINKRYNTSFVDSVTYRKALDALRESDLEVDHRRYRELLLMRNFLGGLTNPKIIELYKKIRIEECEDLLSCKIEKRDKFIEKVSIRDFEKRLERYMDRVSKATA
ncbi:MAG: hypothetical protein HF962_03065 [Sulfurovum sp.]|nr:hypothetical protein [Sulfurovum sp.]